MDLQTPIAVVDTETGGLTTTSRPWEIAVITGGPDEPYATHHVFVSDFATADADPKSLELGGFYDRHPNYGGKGTASMERFVAHDIERLTAGRVLVGCNVHFDAMRLALMLDRHGLAPRWHYTPLDVTAYAAGALGLPPEKLSSTRMADLLGVERDMGTAHTAVADCWYALDLLAAAQQHRAEAAVA